MEASRTGPATARHVPAHRDRDRAAARHRSLGHQVSGRAACGMAESGRSVPNPANARQLRLRHFDFPRVRAVRDALGEAQPPAVLLLDLRRGPRGERILLELHHAAHHLGSVAGAGPSCQRRVRIPCSRAILAASQNRSWRAARCRRRSTGTTTARAERPARERPSSWTPRESRPRR